MGEGEEGSRGSVAKETVSGPPPPPEPARPAGGPPASPAGEAGDPAAPAQDLPPLYLERPIMRRAEDRERWFASRRSNYPTRENLERRRREREALVASGAYSTPSRKGHKTLYRQVQELRGGRARLALRRAEPSLFERVAYQAAREADSLALEALVFIRDHDWLQGEMPAELRAGPLVLQ